MTRVLRIGVDARELLGDTTGVGRYLGELIRRWTGRGDARSRQFILYAPAPLLMTLPAGSAEVRTIGRGSGTWWEQTALRRAVIADKPDVFFAPGYTAPVATGVRTAVTIHDISFIAHPEWFRPRERLRRRVLTTRTAASAAIIFTDSEFSRQEIETRLGCDRRRIRVIPPGVSAVTGGAREETPAPGLGVRGSGLEGPDSGRPRLATTETSALGVEGPDPRPETRDPLVLYVGALFNRRRLPDLIAAFARATMDLPSARLAIVGPDRTWPQQDLQAAADAHGVAGRVDVRSYVTDAELADLYRRASVFAFLSEYEGFGLTPLEALAARVPVILLDTPVAREVCGDAATYVARGDIEGTAAELRPLLMSRAAASAQLAHAPAVLARYSWERAAEETLAHLEAVARGELSVM